ncbi:ankyrin repeat and SAM domain-containing protein 6-like [Abrus precatorius]|uniref:Ankyrin repeat and SAM domain-containing protein 6-like n=1 Tax=Abrus precatorius TaxID=3816 RepID=A0A8B8LD79_ABRPR|nr:ankyrin repeat and SAM domain-containing protein 6-like [Abrus precatorius]
MAAEPETHPPPPEPPIISEPDAEAETAPSAAATTAQPIAEIAGQSPLAPKRQRRPSVRLGEIGDQRGSAHGHESHTRRPSMPPWSWRTPKESSRTSKARPVTNIANGGEEFRMNNRRGKGKRGPSTKRLRSSWTPRTTMDENGDEGFRDFDEDQSPVHSVEENGVDYWHIDRNDDHRVRVSENDGVESESRERRRSEGVRSWLFELGLSRYAPMFEIHEVDDELLPMLTLEDLKDMGINAVGSRRKMYTAIQKLRKGLP